jgi:NAD(P) transhydrogenase subunit alpha
MPTILGIPKETARGERRVALVPAHIAAVKKLGCDVLVEEGAGESAGYPDSLYTEKGARIAGRDEVLGTADLVLAVRSGGADPEGGLALAGQVKEGANLVAILDPYQPHEAFAHLASRQLTVFSMELIPRTTRAQAMDVLSSQANLAGYRGVLAAANLLPRLFPMLMTAAGTLVPAKVFVLGAGVAGLQAIATAKRLGAVVSAFDVRSAVREQVQSLGAKFVEFDLGDASGEGGYAKVLSPEQEAHQKELLAQYIARESIDVIITTAAIPGRASPKLVTEAMVRSMAPGSVIIDLASERGGNCELTQPGETLVRHGVTIAGLLDVASGAAYHASQLYSKNIITFAALLFNKEGRMVVNKNDEIIAGCLVLENGQPSSPEIAQTLGL